MRTYGQPQTLNVVLSNLASTSPGIAEGQQLGMQSDLVDNRESGFEQIHLYVRVKLGQHPSGDRRVFFYALHGDGSLPMNATDGASADAGLLSVRNARRLGDMPTGQTPASGDELVAHYVIDNPGPWWGVAILHNTEVPLAGSGHLIRWVGEKAA